MPASASQRFGEDPAATAALGEVVAIYAQTDPVAVPDPLSGADVVQELGFWLERNHKLLRKLGLVGDEGAFPPHA